MTDRSLLGQLLGWQVLITGTACVLLVAGTMMASALIQAVANVMENARKYAGPSAEIHVGAFESEGYGVITVQDDGPGIPIELRDIVFERFYRDPVHRNRVPGTGLGLAVVDAIVRRHGGHVSTGPSDLGGEQLRISIPLLTRKSTG